MVVDLVTPNRLSSSLISLLLASVAMSQTVELKVRMSCGGCSGAVKRVLSKMEGVESFDIDMEKQKVTVKGNVQPDAVFQTVSKTGKATEYWVEEAPGAADSKAAEVEAKAPVDAKTAEVEAKAPAEAAAVI